MVENKNPVKRLAVLGSTGSIGQQTLDIVRALPNKFKVTGLAAGENLDLLEKQIDEFKPQIVYCRRPSAQIKAKGSKLLSLEEIASHPDVDLVVVATSGKAGLGAVMAAISADKQIALSNKEPLVMAGEIILAEIKKGNGWILPVDSEHSAIWQCLRGESVSPARIILTASGGPFLRFTAEEMAGVTPTQALKHPSWKMGKKVTIDSATLMNKGLEVIEAHWLFDMPYDRIDIVIHPQSIIHSMIETIDGSFKAQMSCPDMRFPIQYALSYPNRLANPTLPKLDWGQVQNLTFEKPDYAHFSCLKLAVDAGKKGGTYPAVLCAADEVAVDLFLKKQIPFTAIPRLIEQVLAKHRNTSSPQLQEILAADEWARAETLSFAGGVKQCRS
ncbi:MAG TPA: 1-deoxy-D-xylulose-5-phosphate reductoisomerase [Dehalococcoidales bacterium]